MLATVPMDLLSHRLIFVTGKGGVGKSAVARALGLVAARQGLRVIVAEIAAPGTAAGIEEVELASGLFGITIDPQAAMEEYLRIKAGPLGGALSHSRLFAALALATPGLRELLGVGKIWELAQLERRTRDGAAYDLVVVDAPATGHGVAALRTPRVFADTARVGPIAHQASAIAATIADRSFTAVVGVSLAEEMPVRETLSLAESLRQDQLELDCVVVNAVYGDRFSDSELESIRAATAEVNGETAPGGHGGATAARAAAADRAAVRSALVAAVSAQARARDQQSHLAQLADAFGERLVSLPYLFCESLDLTELGRLADALEAELG
jgi:anion-transporting  ArsA/GET3 family ATPase